MKLVAVGGVVLEWNQLVRCWDQAKERRKKNADKLSMKRRKGAIYEPCSNLFLKELDKT